MQNNLKKVKDYKTKDKNRQYKKYIVYFYAKI